MANEEQLKILKQGVEVWNEWREEHPEAVIDLSDIELDRSVLHRINLNNANLCRASLRNADLKWANLAGADLRNADFEQSTFIKADLSHAFGVNTNLYKADFFRATLCYADLREANLLAVGLHKADVHGADLRETDLRETTLAQTNLQCANLTGARLYGISRDDWLINDVSCDYVYWYFHGTKRSPKDRNFGPGEFEELYKALPTVEYYFEHGFTPLDPLIMNQAVQTIHSKHPDLNLKLDSFHSRGQPHAVFTIHHQDDAERALQAVTTAYESRLAALEGKQDLLMQLFERVSLGAHINSIEGNVVIQQVQGDVAGNVSGRDSMGQNVTSENSEAKDA